MDKIGVYFSANDAVYDWAVAFLNSFRQFNPELELFLIPFDDKYSKLNSLSSKYNFNVYLDTSFTRLEKIGLSLELGYSSYGPNWFRRYAAFWGPLDHFMYIDARFVILSDLKPFLQLLGQTGNDLLYNDTAIDQVYNYGPLRTELINNGKSKGFLSGAWTSKKGTFTLEEFEQYGKEALKYRNQLNARNSDQAFINYCCDRKSIKLVKQSELVEDFCHCAWAGQGGHIYIDSSLQYRLWNYGGLDHKKRLFLLHWAGYPLSPIMPESALFLKFSDYSFVKKIIFRFKVVFLLPQLLIRNRHINQLYHRLKKAN